MTSQGENLTVVVYQDLQNQYRRHKADVEKYWNSFNQEQRTNCLENLSSNDDLRHPVDVPIFTFTSTGLVSELNQGEITAPNSDYLLKLFEYRATTSLLEQVRGDEKNRPEGDIAYIKQLLPEERMKRLEEATKNQYICFTEAEYGHHISGLEAQEAYENSREDDDVVSMGVGALVLERQGYVFQYLTLLIGKILEVGSVTKSTKQRPRRPDKAAVSAMARLSTAGEPEKMSLADLVATAQDQKSSYEEYLEQLVTEPVVLAHDVRTWFFSNPELVHDESGYDLPVFTDAFISQAFFEVIQGAIKGIAIWSYLCGLVQHFHRQPIDKYQRALTLQELSNVCNLEQVRQRSLLKRTLHCGSGSNLFKRIANSYDSVGNAKVVLKKSPEDLTRANPLLHYMLRLCQSGTTNSTAYDWIKKLAQLQKTHPEEHSRLMERHVVAQGNLAVIACFVHDLSMVVSLPSVSNKKGKHFIGKIKELDAQLHKLKDQLDLSEFSTPVNLLLEPGMAEKAHQVLDQFMVEKTGNKLEKLYLNMVEESSSSLQSQAERVKSKTPKGDTTLYGTFPEAAPSTSEEHVEPRHEKEKTRPAHPLAPETIPADPVEQEAVVPPQPPQTFEVSAFTAKVFERLFDKGKSRGAIDWNDFRSAMTEVGFRMVPKFGSAYTFSPPESMAAERSLTVHRPHHSRIEGRVTKNYARRLERLYGWNSETFKVK